MNRMCFGLTLLVTLVVGFSQPAAHAGYVRRDTQGAGWTVIPSSILQQLPSGLGFPSGLKIGVFGASPVTVDQLPGVTTVRAGFTSVNGVVTPGVLVLTADVEGNTFDAQGPLWWTAPPPPARVVCPGSPQLSFFACPGNLVAGIKIEWGAPALEQLLFFNLGKPRGVELYDSNDYNCSPQGIDNLGNACHYDNVGTAGDPWELSFNCAPSDPVSGVAGGCGTGALQWRGMLYTAPAALLNTPVASNPGQSPPLNEFVYNSPNLYVPPGWQSFFVTTIGLSGPKCEFTAGAPLNFAAVVQPALQSGVPSGTATLLDGTTVLATGTLNSSGAVKFTTTLSSGSHSISVAYQGNSQFAPSQSASDVLVSKNLGPNCRHD
jgi:hypothetical protein